MDYETLFRVAGGLSTIAVGIFGYIYARRLGVKAAQADLNAVNAELIEALKSEVATVRRMLDTHITNVEECEKRLRATEAALAKWDDLIGKVWLEQGGG